METTDVIVWYLMPLLFSALFLVAYNADRTKLITSFFLSCAVISLTGVFCLQAYFSHNPVLRFLLVFILLLCLFMITLGVYIFIAFLILNTGYILKKEKREPKYLLTLVLAVGLVLAIAIPHLIDLMVMPRFGRAIIYSAYGLIIFYFLHLAHFVISIILCNLSRPLKEQDYIVVLGCWIKDGKVTPILARRIDKAIRIL